MPIYAQDIMRTTGPRVGPTDSLARAITLMRMFSVREIPVLGPRGLLGVVARSDLGPFVGQLEWTQVRLAMTSPARTVSADTSLSETARILVDERFNAMPVLVRGEFAGMVSRHEFVELIASTQVAVGTR